MLSCHGHFPTDRFGFPKFGREHRRTGENYKASFWSHGPRPKGILDQLLFICGSILCAWWWFIIFLQSHQTRRRGGTSAKYNFSGIVSIDMFYGQRACGDWCRLVQFSRMIIEMLQRSIKFSVLLEMCLWYRFSTSFMRFQCVPICTARLMIAHRHSKSFSSEIRLFID